MIQVQVEDVTVKQKDDGRHAVALTLRTTNDDFPEEEIRFSLEFPYTDTQAEIKTKIDNTVNLVWIAKQNPSWEISP